MPEYFPQKPNARPIIYAFEEPGNSSLSGMLKVGWTGLTAEERVSQEYPIKKPGKKPYKIVFTETAVRPDGSSFKDHDVFRMLKDLGYSRERSYDGKLTEWFQCSVEQVRAAWLAVYNGVANIEQRDQNFTMRPEQAAAVEKTMRYFESVETEGSNHSPKFLWNAKMRFGKTFATYQLAKRMDFQRVLILTFKPAVRTAWHDDLMRHIDFEGWQFISRDGMQYEEADPKRPIVCFGSFQDFLVKNKETGRIKPRNEWVHLEDWDLVVFDEYHFGAWNENAKGLFSLDDEDERETEEAVDNGDGYDETWLPIQTKRYLYLSGTPFRALNSGEFIEEQIFNWTYSDEQRSKHDWPKVHPKDPNPYESLPRMVLMTYQMPDEIKAIARAGEFNTFDLNEFFKAEGENEQAEFVHKEHVQKWLDLIRGAYTQTAVDDLKLGAEKPPAPFSHVPLLNVLNHTLWYLPRVNSCFAMNNLLQEKQNTFYHDYKINVCAGSQAGIGADALDKVQESMADPLESKTITLTCGKLTTGVTVKPWTGIFMLSNIGTPEAYFQAAFRVQSPWVITDEEKSEIVKQECYVFDFALDRALRMVSDYSCRLGSSDVSPERKVDEFIEFLPVLAYDGSSMKEVSAADILDTLTAGTSATLLARRWESALLVNVDNDTLKRLLANEDALNALMSIEAFRNLNRDLETIINQSENVKKTRKNSDDLSPDKKRELTEEEKELKSRRKEVQEKLIKFATRIPIFMYLTDYREETLKDVITQLEPGIFKKVTGLSVQDFELLISLGLFNDSLMNDAVYKFRRYEDSSLTYTGIDKHEGEGVGLFDTTLSEFEYLELTQQESMIAPSDFGQNKREGEQSKPPAKEPASSDSSASKSGTTKRSGAVASKQKASKEKVPETEKEPKKPAVTQDELDSLKVGDKVFHKAFGAGEIVDLEGGYISVSFEEDNQKKKPCRKFAFPQAFYDGLLQIG